MVKVYSKPGCTMCVATKRKMTTSDIEFREIDVSKDNEALEHVLSLGYKQMPVVETETTHWSGYDEEKIKELASN